jgi:hypothetical protein
MTYRCSSRIGGCISHPFNGKCVFQWELSGTRFWKTKTVECKESSHEGVPPKTPTNIWPETSSEIEFTSISNSKPSSPTESTSVSRDNEELAWVNNLQLQVHFHIVGNEIIPSLQMVQISPKGGEARAHFPEPMRLDVDAVCILMCTVDLLVLLGKIARPTNRQIVIKDDEFFNN